MKPFPEEGEKHGEVDRSGRVIHHVVQVLVGDILARTLIISSEKGREWGEGLKNIDRSQGIDTS